METPDSPPAFGPTPEMEAGHARAAASRAAWKALPDDEKAARTAEGWKEFHRRLADGAIVLPPRVVSP